ncbi:MAG: NAD-dependent epimerase [Granulosicoccus sp.]
MKVLITGTAGFIGSSLAIRLLERGDEVIGVDNINDYYDVNLKLARLERVKSYDGFTEVRGALEDRELLDATFHAHQPQRVVNLAAQAGVRYSLENPQAYIDSNIVGFTNILESCRHHKTEHLVYASTSSVYGNHTNMPFSVHDSADHPVSLYAATKKANELMAHTYSHLFQLPTTGLRFFTVYGPWGRPDMALFLFTRKILAGEPIDVFNYGKHKRDFTYIDDIVEGVVRTLDNIAQTNADWDSANPDPATSSAPFRIYNIGNNQPIDLEHYIHALETCLNRTAEKNLLPLQPGDVPDTFADVSDLVRDVDYKPDTSVEEGISRFVDWYLDYYDKPQP